MLSARGWWRCSSFLTKSSSSRGISWFYSAQAGEEIFERRRAVLARIALLLDDERAPARGYPPPLAAQAVANGVLGVVSEQLSRRQTGPLVELAGPLMSFMVLPFLGVNAARRELARPRGVTSLTQTGPLGCKKASASTCEVNVTAAREVTAVFLQEGVQGKNGEGVTIEVLARGEHGCAAGGIAVKVGAAGAPTYVCNGKEGEVGVEGIEGLPGPEGKTGLQGERGAAGASGATGSAGAQGPPGPAGPAGKEGPAGKVELVTCTKVGNRQKCTTKLVLGTVKFTATGASAHATLSRHGAVYAAGTVHSAHGRMSLRLLTVRRLNAGRYTLTLISGSGRHERIRSEAFTLR
jgi:hypothetical protein